jgi:hypothetical protein
VSDDIEPCHYQREEEKCRHAWTDDLRAFNHDRSVAFRGLVRGHSLRPSYLSVLYSAQHTELFGLIHGFVSSRGGLDSFGASDCDGNGSETRLFVGVF